MSNDTKLVLLTLVAVASVVGLFSIVLLAPLEPWAPEWVRLVGGAGASGIAAATLHTIALAWKARRDSL